MAIKVASVQTVSSPFWQQSLLAILSGLLLSIPFLDAQYFGFAWIAFIPFLSAINGAGLARSYCLGMLSGLAFCISAGYWVVDFLMLSKGYGISASVLWALVFWVYCAQQSALIAVSFNWLKARTSVHEFMLFPLIIVTLYSAFPMLFTVRLGESQSQFLSVIQAVEITGVHGLDAIIALANIALFRLLQRLFTSQKKIGLVPYMLAIAAIVAWFAYGATILQRWDLNVAESEMIRVGIVQPNEAPSLEKFKAQPGYSLAYPPEMEMTERLSEAGAELVIWPESKYKAYLDQPHVSHAFQKQLTELNTSLVFQDIEHIASKQSDSLLRYNTALMINNDGEQLGQYQKMKRIPFGEYVPLVSDVPVLRAWVEDFFGKFLNEMAEGQSHQFFANDNVNVIPLICYEVVFPEFVAAAVSHTQSHSKLGSILVGLSSNAWFGTTRQPYQHVNTSILRAVENRLPLVHAVNNGPSIVVLPSGRISFISEFHQAGGYLVDVPYSAEVERSYYSQHPKLFIYSAYGLVFLIGLFSIGQFKRKE